MLFCKECVDMFGGLENSVAPKHLFGTLLFKKKRNYITKFIKIKIKKYSLFTFSSKTYFEL